MILFVEGIEPDPRGQIVNVTFKMGFSEVEGGISLWVKHKSCTYMSWLSTDIKGTEIGVV